jgi:hypothetical protein
MIKDVTKLPSENLEMYKVDILEQIVYFHSHLFSYYDLSKPPLVKYILLIRDPRDVIRSQLDWIERVNDRLDQWGDINLIEKKLIEWVSYLDVVLYNTIVVQYERLCLYPVKTIERILRFGKLDAKASIIDTVERFDQSRGHQIHKTGMDRYKEHCSKWKTDERLLGNFNDLVWDTIGDVMIHYGYLKDGHSVNLVRE